MRYASAQQLVQQFGLAEISQLLSDEDSLISEELLADALAANDLDDYTEEEQAAVAAALVRINQVLDMQSQFMESKIGMRYTIPLDLSQEQIDTSPLLECCLALSRAALSDDDDNMTDGVSKQRDHWRSWLNDIAKGTAIIVGLSPTKNTSGAKQNRIVGQSKSRINWNAYDGRCA